MEKSQARYQNHHPQEKKEKPQQQQQQKQSQNREKAKQHPVWDCGSNLYDSFELNSFNRQLDSAIHSRTMSMPHLVDRAPPQSTASALPPPVSKKQLSKFSRSIQKLFKSMFRFRQSSSSSLMWLKQRSHDDYYVVYDKTGSLTTIPEVPEIEFGGRPSPEINSLVAKRTASERFTAASTVGISCA